MGFFDKVKGAVDKIKEDNKYFAKTTARINNGAAYYGTVNHTVKDGDFRQGSYVNVEDGHGVIYNTGDEDYTFTADDFVSFSFQGQGKTVKQGDRELHTMSFIAEFKDGKKAHMNIFFDKVDNFKVLFNLNN